ncbi:MAG: hypothetical protein OXC63_15380 [Aestuariivita sp.]|nr:hypothetical protein [Aestuariivita sp.]MCY4346790.1 hypothetical protein [Aestuariivita sp.]
MSEDIGSELCSARPRGDRLELALPSTQGATSCGKGKGGTRTRAGDRLAGTKAPVRPLPQTQNDQKYPGIGTGTTAVAREFIGSSGPSLVRSLIDRTPVAHWPKRADT